MEILHRAVATITGPSGWLLLGFAFIILNAALKRAFVVSNMPSGEGKIDKYKWKTSKRQAG